MFYYTVNDNGDIVQFLETSGNKKPPEFAKDWKKTTDKIICLHDGSLAFEKNVNLTIEQNAVAAIDIQQKIAKIDAEYSRAKSQLLQYYAEASVLEDSEMMADIKQELLDLGEQYDNDLAELEG